MGCSAGRRCSTLGGSILAGFSAAGRFSSIFGGLGAASGLASRSAAGGFAAVAGGAASGLVSFSTAGGFPAVAGALGANPGATGFPAAGGFSLFSGKTLLAGAGAVGAAKAALPAALAGITPFPLNSPACSVAAIAGLPRFVDTNCSLLMPAARA